MRFRTEIPPFSLNPLLGPTDGILSLGSCFAERIGERLSVGEHPVEINPLGTLYHPLSLSRALSLFCGSVHLSQEELFYHEGLFRHWDVHTRLCDPERESAWDKIQAAVQRGSRGLRRSRWLYLTLGTAFVWERSGQIVANCHKMPNQQFSRRILSVEECIQSLKLSLADVWSINPDLNVVLTVSPVRYLRDGLIQNQRAKSTLVLAAHSLVDGDTRVHYFPSYELLLDDLRDYRFFDRDFAHPSEEAIDYIWSRYLDACVDSEYQNQLQRKIKLSCRRNHRQIHI